MRLPRLLLSRRSPRGPTIKSVSDSEPIPSGPTTGYDVRKMYCSTVVDDGRGSRVAYGIIFLFLLALTLFPILANPRLPLLDYPSHLGRAYILRHLHEVPAFSGMYRSEWRLYHNLSIDAIVVPLQTLVSLGSAAKIFEVLLVLFSYLGAHLLGREIHGRPTFLAPITIYFLFSLFMLYGFVNYLFGLGVFYLAFAVWLRAFRTNDRQWLAVVVAQAG